MPSSPVLLVHVCSATVGLISGFLAIFLRKGAGLSRRLAAIHAVATRTVGIFDLSALLVALAIGVAGVTWGLEAATSPTGLKDKYPADFYFVFGSVALLFATSDVRMLLAIGLTIFWMVRLLVSNKTKRLLPASVRA